MIPQLPTRGRRGYSLVEVLLIVGIVMALVLMIFTAANYTRHYVLEVQTLREIQQLSDACEAFKLRYGRYPPSIIILSEKGYSLGDPETVPVPSSDITRQSALESSGSTLKSLFPGIDLELYTTSGGKEWHDWNGNGVPDDPWIGITYERALPFFLGGIPRKDPESGVITLTGFNKDRTRPTRPSGPGVDRDGPFFEFDPKRLLVFDPYHFDAAAHEAWVLTTFLHIPVYLDLYGTPYAYASSRKSYMLYNLLGFTPRMYLDSTIRIPRFPNSLESIFPYYVHDDSIDTDPTDKVNDVRRIYYHQNSFQIISAGPDGYFGKGGLFPVEDPENYTLRQEYHQMLDNYTNFHNGPLRTMQRKK